MSLLVLENISKEYKNQRVLKDVSLRIEKWERVALVGPNGSGKSTLLKIAMGLENADSGTVIKARKTKVAYLSQQMEELEQEKDNTALYYEKVSRLEKKLKSIEKEMEIISQQGNYDDYDKLLKEYSRILSEYESADGYVIENKIKKILLGLGLKKEVLTLPLSNLSGGEKMRVALARMLIQEPDLLILDEPTNHLDIKAIEWLEDFLKKFSGGVLIVSHDRYFLDQIVTRVAELRNGTITVKSCSYSQFMDQKNQMREYYFKERKGLELQVKREKSIIQELKRMGKVKTWKSREKQLNKLIGEMNEAHTTLKEKEHLKKDTKPNLKFKKIKHVSKEIAWAKGLTKSFGNVSILKNASFHIAGGNRVALIGANGCGKTTLLNILLGKDKEYQGTAVLGEWVSYSYLGQEVEFEDENRTILQEIISIKEMSEVDARAHLSKFQFYGEVVGKKLSILSGGERVRVYLAGIMLEEPHCLIMDEPTNHLDLEGREAVEKAIQDFKGTVIAVSHDRYFLTNSINRIFEFSEGKINSYEGNYEYYRKTVNCNENNEGNKKKSNRIEKKTIKNKLKNTSKQRKLSNNINEIEEKISDLEKKAKEFEKGFNEDTSLEEYKEYGIITEKLNELFNLWEDAASAEA